MRPTPRVLVTRTAGGTLVQVADFDEDRTSPSLIDNTEFVRCALGKPSKVHFLSRRRILDNDWPVPSGSMLYQSAHHAFQNHRGLTISPEVFFYAVGHEVTICVKQHPRKYAHCFTSKPNERQKIEVRDDSLVYGEENNWAHTITLFDGELRRRIDPSVIDLFLPRLSTMTAEDEVALLTTFMDTSSSYYEYSVATLCGIPRILVRGSAEDWETIVHRLRTFSTMFKPLQQYFAEVMLVADEIARTVADERVDPEFWISLYKWASDSDTPTVTGWISALSAYALTPEGFVLRRSFEWRFRENSGWNGITASGLPSHISKVPFVWNYFGREIPMIFGSGVLGVEYTPDEQGGFVTPKLGFGVCEV